MKKTALEIFENNALLYQNRYMNLDLYDASYDAFLSRLQSGAKVLELGCGPGNVTRHLLQKRPDLKILATDFAPKMIELAKKNVPNATFRLLDAKNISSLDEKFDAIVCGFISPYLDKSELSKLVSDCSELSTPNAKLYLSTIEGEHEKSGWQSSSDGKSSAFVHLYSQGYLTELLSRSRFSVSETFRIPFGKDVHLVFIAQLS